MPSTGAAGRGGASLDKVKAMDEVKPVDEVKPMDKVKSMEDVKVTCSAVFTFCFPTPYSIYASI